MFHKDDKNLCYKKTKAYIINSAGKIAYSPAE